MSKDARSYGIMKTAFSISALILVLILMVGCTHKPSVQEKSTKKSGEGTEAVSNRTSAENDATAKKKKGDEKPTQELKVVSQKIDLTWQEAGKSRMKATASEMTGNTISGIATLKKVNADLYDKGQLSAKLAAPVVEADEKTRIVTASGGVTIVSAAPNTSIRTLRADNVKWYSKDDKLIGEGGIVANGPMGYMKAAVFVADTRLSKVHIYADPAQARAVLGKH